MSNCNTYDDLSFKSRDQQVTDITRAISHEMNGLPHTITSLASVYNDRCRSRMQQITSPDGKVSYAQISYDHGTKGIPSRIHLELRGEKVPQMQMIVLNATRTMPAAVFDKETLDRLKQYHDQRENTMTLGPLIPPPPGKAALVNGEYLEREARTYSIGFE